MLIMKSYKTLLFISINLAFLKILFSGEPCNNLVYLPGQPCMPYGFLPLGVSCTVFNANICYGTKIIIEQFDDKSCTFHDLNAYTHYVKSDSQTLCCRYKNCVYDNSLNLCITGFIGQRWQDDYCSKACIDEYEDENDVPVQD